MMIQGRIKDIQPNQVKPTLELTFDAKDSGKLPPGNPAVITLDLNGTRWNGTINNSTGSNRPFLHTNLTQPRGATSTCTEEFLWLRLADGAIIDFDYVNNTLQLVKIVHHGAW